MAGSGVQDERLNDPDGFREGGSAFATDMDDLNPDAHLDRKRTHLAHHRQPLQWAHNAAVRVALLSQLRVTTTVGKGYGACTGDVKGCWDASEPDS